MSERNGIHASAVIHPSAMVDDGANVGAETRIWHFCHVMAGADIGSRCVLGQNVFVGGAAVIGDGCRIQNNVSIYDGVLLEEDVFVGPSVVFTNVTAPRAFLSRKAQFRTTAVGRGASIGANATILCGRKLGIFCLVAAGAVVTRDVSAHALVAGVPGRRVGWVCRCGQTLAPVAPDHPGREPGELECAACRAHFRVVRNGRAAAEASDARGELEDGEEIVPAD